MCLLINVLFITDCLRKVFFANTAHSVYANSKRELKFRQLNSKFVLLKFGIENAVEICQFFILLFNAKKTTTKIIINQNATTKKPHSLRTFNPSKAIGIV